MELICYRCLSVVVPIVSTRVKGMTPIEARKFKECPNCGSRTFFNSTEK